MPSPSDTSSTCLSYDAQGRLITVTKASGLSVSMTYNAQGQRMSYAATGPGNNLTENFLYRGGELAQVVDDLGEDVGELVVGVAAFSTNVLPVTMQIGVIQPCGIIAGKFHGAMPAKTPIGSLKRTVS